MNPVLTPTLALTRSGNNTTNALDQRRDLKIVLVLNGHATTAHVEKSKADSDCKSRRTPLAGSGKPGAGKPIRRYIARPPERWGINE